MAAAVFDICINDFKQKFQSSAELVQYVKDRLVPKLQEAATEVWNSSTSRPRALDQAFSGELAGFWAESQPFNSREVSVSVGVSVKF